MVHTISFLESILNASLILSGSMRFYMVQQGHFFHANHHIGGSRLESSPKRAKAVEAAQGQKSIKLTFNDSKYAFQFRDHRTNLDLCESIDSTSSTSSDTVLASLYQSKSTFELLRAALCFKLFSYEPLVENNMQIMAKTKQIFGQSIFNLAMKATVYGQFVAGEDKDKIKVRVKWDSDQKKCVGAGFQRCFQPGL